jgi:hypothetical protein
MVGILGLYKVSPDIVSASYLLPNKRAVLLGELADQDQLLALGHQCGCFSETRSEFQD